MPGISSGKRRPESLGIRGGEVANKPGDDDLAEDDGVGPDLDLAAEVPALGIDPSFFGDIATTEKKISVGDGHLGVFGAGDDEHGSGGLAEKILRDKRKLRENVGKFVGRLAPGRRLRRVRKG